MAGTFVFWRFYLTRQTGWAWVSTAKFAVSILLFIFEYTLYCRFSDRLYPKKNSPAVCKLLHDAGLSCGIDIPKTDFYPGANDSEAFSRNGIPAAALCAVSHHPTGYYHTRYDSWDNLNPEGITLTRNVLLAVIKLFDEKESLSNDL